jgi:hypothetical protein
VSAAVRLIPSPPAQRGTDPAANFISFQFLRPRSKNLLPRMLLSSRAVPRCPCPCAEEENECFWIGIEFVYHIVPLVCCDTPINAIFHAPVPFQNQKFFNQIEYFCHLAEKKDPVSILPKRLVHTRVCLRGGKFGTAMMGQWCNGLGPSHFGMHKHTTMDVMGKQS